MKYSDHPQLKEYFDDTIKEIGDSNQSLVIKTLDKIYQFLMVMNSGGAVAILGYMGSLKGEVALGPKLALGFFVIGIIFYGGLLALVWHLFTRTKFEWIKNSSEFVKNKIDWGELVKRHASSAQGKHWWLGLRWDLLFAYGSFFAFILGSTFGILSILF